MSVSMRVRFSVGCGTTGRTNAPLSARAIEACVGTHWDLRRALDERPVAEPETSQPAAPSDPAVKKPWQGSGPGGFSWKAIGVAALGIYALLLIIQNSRSVWVSFVFFSQRTRVMLPRPAVHGPGRADHVAHPPDATGTQGEALVIGGRDRRERRARKRSGRNQLEDDRPGGARDLCAPLDHPEREDRPSLEDSGSNAASALAG